MPQPQPAQAKPEGKKRRAWIAPGLFLLAFAVYANSLGHDFVWDDDPVIRKNKLLAAPGAFWKCFGRDFGLEITGHPAGYYRPLVFVSFVLNHKVDSSRAFRWLYNAIAGTEKAATTPQGKPESNAATPTAHTKRPFLYHLTNVLLHAVNTLLVFWLIGRLAGIRVGSLTAAVFAVHPVHAESVAFIAGRSDLLCALFLLLSLLAMTRSFSTRGGRRILWQGIAIGAYAASLLSKELAIALPGVLLAHAFLRRYRWRNLLRLCAPAILVALVYLTFRLLFMPMAGLGRSDVASDESRIARAAHLAFVYAAQQTFPVIPTLGAEVLARRPWVDGAAVVLLVLLLVVARPRNRAAMAVLWLALFLAPAFWVSLFAGIELSDRFAYVPSVGICALAALAAGHYWERYPLSRLVAVTILAAFGALSFVYSGMWRDEIRLWTASVAYHPECGRCYYNLGNAYSRARNPTQAVRNLRKATELFQDGERRCWAYANLADILAAAGEDSLAVDAYQRAIALRPRRPHMRFSLALLLADMGRHDEALAQLEAARDLAPDNRLVHLELAREYLAIDPPRRDRAREHYQRARELGAQPDAPIETDLETTSDEP